MTKRSQWCDIDKETRKYVLKRDNNKCIICGSKKPLTIAHIFMSRAKGGKGCKENLTTLCTNCHYYTLDNPIGLERNRRSKEILDFCKNYLIEKEHINPDKEFMDSLKYKKEINKIEINTNIDFINLLKKKDRCKNCKHLVKNKYSNSSIPSYYCKYRKILINKTTPACKSFKNTNDVL